MNLRSVVRRPHSKHFTAKHSYKQQKWVKSGSKASDPQHRIVIWGRLLSWKLSIYLLHPLFLRESSGSTSIRSHQKQLRLWVLSNHLITHVTRTTCDLVFPLKFQPQPLHINNEWLQLWCPRYPRHLLLRWSICQIWKLDIQAASRSITLPAAMLRPAIGHGQHSWDTWLSGWSELAQSTLGDNLFQGLSPCSPFTTISSTIA